MALSHTVYFLFGALDFAREYVALHKPEARVVVYTYEAFSIDHAIELRTQLSQYGEDDVVPVIRIERMSFDAQNALLKICEDFTHGHVFFSFSPRVSVLDTLLSRGIAVYAERNSFHFGVDTAKSFYTGTFAGRMKLFETLTKEYPELEPKMIVTYMIEDLVLENKKIGGELASNGRVFIEGLELLNYQKSSPKQIFEYIALTVK